MITEAFNPTWPQGRTMDPTTGEQVQNLYHGSLIQPMQDYSGPIAGWNTMVQRLASETGLRPSDPHPISDFLNAYAAGVLNSYKMPPLVLSGRFANENEELFATTLATLSNRMNVSHTILAALGNEHRYCKKVLTIVKCECFLTSADIRQIVKLSKAETLKDNAAREWQNWNNVIVLPLPNDPLAFKSKSVSVIRNDIIPSASSTNSVYRSISEAAVLGFLNDVAMANDAPEAVVTNIDGKLTDPSWYQSVVDTAQKLGTEGWFLSKIINAESRRTADQVSITLKSLGYSQHTLQIHHRQLPVWFNDTRLIARVTAQLCAAGPHAATLL